ncbi:MAG: alpha/beta fold hydrolase [Acidimicrobiales bacterium]
MSLLSVTRRGVGRPFLWLHGFTQTRDSAHQFRSILAEARELWTLDLPGHGLASALSADLAGCADLVADAMPDGPIDLGGYSLGGRVALHVVTRHPERVRRVVALGATRGIVDVDERAERRRRDEELATRAEVIGASAFLDEWVNQPLFATLPADATDRAARSNDSRGLAMALRRMGTGTQEFLDDPLSRVVAPTLALAGELDLRFVDEARAIAATVVDGRAAVVVGAGHAAHLERPGDAARLVGEFLD